MEEDDSFLYAIQEIFSLPQLIAYENADSIMHQSLYERNPIKYVISEKAKEELQKCKYKEALNKENCKCCCITQDDFLDDDDIIQLPCEHCFFPDPIIKWLTEESCSCPVCKKSLDSVEIKKEENNEPTSSFLYNNYNYNFNNTMFLDETFFDTLFINNNAYYANFFVEEDNHDASMNVD
jgi:hypothetical protein